MNGVIFDIQHCSVSDGEGVRTTVFLKGCPLRCQWCHNPESQSVQKQLLFYRHKCVNCGKCAVCTARKFDGELHFDRSVCILCGKCTEICPKNANELCGREVCVDDVIDEAVEDMPFYTDGGGMTLSGGEPSMQPEFSLALIREAQKRSIGVSVETCGFGDAAFFVSAAELGVTFLFDIKELDSELHRKLTGVGNEKILSNLQLLFDRHADVVLRLPIIPSANDSEAEIQRLSAFLSKHRHCYRRAELIPYHILGKSKEDALDRDGYTFDAKISRKRAEEIAVRLSDAACVKVI